MAKSKSVVSFTEFDKRSFRTHLSRIESGLGLYEERKYPSSIKTLQKMFKWLIEYTCTAVDESIKEYQELVREKKKRRRKIDEEDTRSIVFQMKAQTARILRFYNLYWGSVEFALYSVPWYFNQMLMDILKRILREKEEKDLFLIVFPATGYNLEIISIQDELKKGFEIDLGKMHRALKEYKLENYYIFRLPPYLVLDPMANFLILHEVGHYFAKFKINPSVIKETVKKVRDIIKNKIYKNLNKEQKSLVFIKREWENLWMNELISDCFCAAIGGPASLAAAEEFFILRSDLPSTSHPSPSFRKRIIKCCLNYWIQTARGADKKQETLKEYFSDILITKEDPLINLMSEFFDVVRAEAKNVGLYYFDMIINNIKKGFNELKNEMLPIDLIPGKKDWLFDYVLALNCAWSLYLKKTKDISAWRDKYNEIILKLLEVEQFRDTWKKNEDLESGGVI